MGSKEVIKEKKFDKEANKQHVKDRSQYKVVLDYEKDFKHDFGGTLGDMAQEVIKKLNKQLNL